MSYKLERFGATLLPFVNPTPDVGTGPSRENVLELPDGSLYNMAGARAARAKTVIPLQATLLGTKAALDSAYDDLRALRGTQAKLWRRRADNSLQWCLAVMMSIQARPDYRIPHKLDIDISFLMLSPHWYGLRHDGGWYLDDGEYFDDGLALDSTETTTLDSSPKTITLPNDGNRELTNVLATITAGSAAITALTIEISGLVDLEYSNTVAAGQSLVIDAGARSVLNNGVDAYADLALGSGHATGKWLELEPGDNDLVVTLTGGSTDSTITFEYYDAWE